MATSSGLEQMPAEVVELIVRLLDFLDICNLRLVSRDISAKSSHGLVKSHFAAKTVAWTSVEQLERFVEQTQLGWRGCLLQDLTVSSIIPVTGVVQATGQHEVCRNLLTKAFSNLRIHSPHGFLTTLTMLVQGQSAEGAVVSGDEIRDWTQTWHASARTFKIILDALAASELPVHQLDIFTKHNRCSLACDQIEPALDNNNLTASLYKLTHLSLSLSKHLIRTVDNEAQLDIIVAKENVDGLYRFIDLCVSLRSFHLHWYSLGFHSTRTAQTEEGGFLQHLLPLENLKQLEECRLQGISTNESTLLAFVLKMQQLRSMYMEEVYLLDGSFQPIFDHLTSRAEHLEHLYLDDLWQDRHICFSAPGKPHFVSKGNYHQPHDMTWPGGRSGRSGRRRNIKYRPILGRALGSAACSNWLHRRRLKYGPPDFRNYIVRP